MEDNYNSCSWFMLFRDRELSGFVAKSLKHKSRRRDKHYHNSSWDPLLWLYRYSNLDSDLDKNQKREKGLIPSFNTNNSNQQL